MSRVLINLIIVIV